MLFLIHFCYLSRVMTVYSFVHHALGAVVDHVRLMCLSGYIQTSFSIFYLCVWLITKWWYRREERPSSDSFIWTNITHITLKLGLFDAELSHLEALKDKKLNKPFVGENPFAAMFTTWLANLATWSQLDMNCKSSRELKLGFCKTKFITFSQLGSR